MNYTHIKRNKIFTSAAVLLLMLGPMLDARVLLALSVTMLIIFFCMDLIINRLMK